MVKANGLCEAAHKKSAPTTAAAPTPRPAETRGAMPVKRVVGLAAVADAAAAEDVPTGATTTDVVAAAEVAAAAVGEVARVVLVPLQAAEPNCTWPSPIWQAGVPVTGLALEVEAAEVMTGATTTDVVVTGAAEVAREVDVDMTGATMTEEVDVGATTTADDEAARVEEAAEEESTTVFEEEDVAEEEERAAGGV